MSDDLRKRIGEIAKLEHNWNSYGAPAIATEVIHRAVAVSRKLGDGWHVYPCTDGGIQFEHDNDDEILVRPQGTYEVTLLLERVEELDALATRQQGTIDEQRREKAELQSRATRAETAVEALRKVWDAVNEWAHTDGTDAQGNAAAENHIIEAYGESADNVRQALADYDAGKRAEPLG